MKKHSEETPEWHDQRDRIIGLGELSIRKSYYPELQQKMAELEKKNADLKAAYEDLSAQEEELRQNYEEIRARESELRESKDFLKEIIDNAKDGIVFYDRNFNYRVWNSFMESLTGISATDAVGKNAFRLFPHLHEQKVDILLQRALSGEIIRSPDIRYDIPQTEKSGWMSGIYCPHYNGEGEIVGVIGIIRDITERKGIEEALKKAHDEMEIRVQERTAALRESEERLRLKLDSVLSPDSDINDLELINILDIPAIQSLMEDFTRLTGMVTAILDLKGNVIEATGWQDICTKFHRVNERTAQFCRESDLFLSQNLKAGDYVAHKCRNNLWDVVTPLYIGNKHFGNIFIGQFFYDDEIIDEAVFIAQAEEYGFDRDDYLAALHRVPRFSRDRIKNLMDYLVKLTGFISRLSYSNLKLARTMAEEKTVQETLIRSERRLAEIIDHLPDATLAIDLQGKIIAWNKAIEEMTGVKAENMLGKNNHEYALPFYGCRRPFLLDSIFASDTELAKQYNLIKRNGDLVIAEVDVVLPGDRKVTLWGKATPLHDEMGKIIGAIESIRDVTDRKRARDELQALYNELENRVIERTAELNQAQAAYKQANEKLNLLNSITRHDITNQLSMLQGYLVLISRKISDTSVAEMLEKAQNTARTIHRQITFTKDYQNIGVKSPGFQNIEGIIRQAVNALPHEHIVIESHLDNLEVYADPLLEKVVYNLVENAIRYGEKITKIQFFHQDVPEGLKVICEDDGVGISDEDKLRLFTKGFGKNTGLGLYLSREILGITGISIRETGQYGKGARFEITVPKGTYRFPDQK